MKGLRALGQLIKIALQYLGEGIEQRPPIAGFELRMIRSFPLLQNFGDVTTGASTALESLNDEIICFHAREVLGLVGVEPLLLIVPVAGQLAERPSNQLRQVAQNVTGVTAAQFDLTVER